jgi:acyl carrier protein
MRDIILKYINEQFGENSKKDGSHFSYCAFPEEECTCKVLEDIDYDTSLIRGGYIDSFSLIVVILFLQKTFNVKFPEKEMIVNNFDTVNNMVNTIIKLKQ